MTNFLGFDMFAGDEWKVMGLAAYGKPEYADFLGGACSVDGPDGFRVDIRVLDHHLAKRYQFSEEAMRDLGPPRAAGRGDQRAAPGHRGQRPAGAGGRRPPPRRFLKERTGEENLCLAGGVAFNSVMNGRIIRESPFRRVFIQPVAGDAGCSLGAAYLLHHRLGGARPRRWTTPTSDRRSTPRSAPRPCRRRPALRDPCGRGAAPPSGALLADGAIVGWFQGRAEFGPRALGNRSFLADPRRSDIRELLNAKVKLREWFRPLAPSMLEEGDADVRSRAHDPFMITVLNVAEDQRDRIPAVVHVDGTARPQTVSRETNPRYWRLLAEFEALTGVPVLLNTSFNVQEPIVCTPTDAIRTFQASAFDVLVLEDHLVRRPPADTRPTGEEEPRATAGKATEAPG